MTRAFLLSFISLSQGGEDRSFSPFSPVFLCFLRVNDALAREHVARFFFLDFFSLSLAGIRRRRRRRESFFVFLPPLFLPPCSPFALSLSLSRSLSVFRENEKRRTTLCKTLYFYFLICETHTYTHNASEYSSLFIVFITSSSKRINRNY